MKDIVVNDKTIGDESPCYIVAEIGGAFKTFEEAKKLIDSAREINVDAIKFQTLDAETITTKNNILDLEITGKVSQYEFFKDFEISKELQRQVVEYAKKKGITIFSAPSHIKDLELLQEMELTIFKIGSDLACHVPLIKQISTFGKPVIISTGMCTLEEVRRSVEAARSAGNNEIILMHCVSNYPSKIDELNLKVIETMKKEFNLPVGFSDHTVGTLGVLQSVMLGANIVEKHFRDSTNAPGPDDVHSLTKEEFKGLIRNIRDMEKAKGTGIKKPTESESKNLKTNRVSIVSIKDIEKGDILSINNIDIRRPGHGLEPYYFEQIIGKKAKTKIPSDEPVLEEMVDFT
jgi:N,N'-diacetyllegionaminate synthase